MFLKNTQEGYEWFLYNKPSFAVKYQFAKQFNNITEVTADMGIPYLIK